MPSSSDPSQRKASTARSLDHHHHRSHHAYPHSHGHRRRNNSRSCSPHRSDRHRSDHHRPRLDRERDYRERKGHRSIDPSTQPLILPLGARELSRRDLEAYKPMFAMYLDIQKSLFIEDMEEEEVKGRWKSFVKKWYVRSSSF